MSPDQNNRYRHKSPEEMTEEHDREDARMAAILAEAGGLLEGPDLTPSLESELGAPRNGLLEILNRGVAARTLTYRVGPYPSPHSIVKPIQQIRSTIEELYES